MRSKAKKRTERDAVIELQGHIARVMKTVDFNNQQIIAALSEPDPRKYLADALRQMRKADPVMARIVKKAISATRN